MNKKNIIRRNLCASIALGSWLAGPALAAESLKKIVPGGASPWRLLINEAVTGETNIFLLTNRYQPLADYVTQHAKVRSIGIEPVVDIQRFMRLAQGQTKPELVFGKSVNLLVLLVCVLGFLFFVRRSDPYKAAFIVDKTSTIRTMADVGQARIIMPDEFAATTAVARAELRRLNIANPVVTHVRYQEAVEQQVKSGMGQVGVVNPTIARKWAAEGGRVLAETQPVVNWSLLAGPNVPAETASQLRESLLAMNTNASSVIGAIGIKQWAKAERQDYFALLDYSKD